MAWRCTLRAATSITSSSTDSRRSGEAQVLDRRVALAGDTVELSDHPPLRVRRREGRQSLRCSESASPYSPSAGCSCSLSA